jgi:hypothetical protein
MKTLYVGDARDIVARICTNHGAGNVEGSALRRYVAHAMGLGLTRTRRPSGSTRVRIRLPDPRVGERAVSAYIRSGWWRLALCESYEEAKALQWLAIEVLKSIWNTDRRPTAAGSDQRFKDHLRQLAISPLLPFEAVRAQRPGLGVYVFYHVQSPRFETEP